MVPELKATPKEVGEALTLTGFMMDGFEDVMYNGQQDYLLGLEIRQNRPDCLSVIGLAREVAAYYDLQLKLPLVNENSSQNDTNLAINIDADECKRVLAIKLENVINGESPKWLKEYMEFYGLNSTSLLVDLSNYVMLVTGYPSHLIDFEKTTGAVSWSINDTFDEIVTLFGTSVPLKKNSELIIRDEKNILALAGIVGGNVAEINIGTKTIIAEVAVYNRSIIRKNSRNLNIVTEASHRLEKDLDPNGAEYAMKLLVSLIEEHAMAKVGSKLFDYYPEKHISPKISFDLELPGKFAGVEISEKDTLEILKNLGFIVEQKENLIALVTPPEYRLDVSLPEDVVEEVVRIFGYDKIPSNEIPKLQVVTDITPKNIIVSERIREILSTLGFDEILSWPLTREGANRVANYQEWEEVSTQNSVNDLYPNLRQSIVTGLLNQLSEYNKKNVGLINIFEVGKVFGKIGDGYVEHDSLGVMAVSDGNILPEFKNKVETLLRLMGFNSVNYLNAQKKPELANQNSCWDIIANGQSVGIIYKLTPQETKQNTYFSEINIQKITELLSGLKNNPVVEITQKLVVLDINVELGVDESIYAYMEGLKEKFEEKYLWSVVIADTYPLEKKIKYTLRVTYKELSDQEAKKIHSQIFNL